MRRRPTARATLVVGILECRKALLAVTPIVTTEERVDSLDAAPNACILPHWVVDAVCLVNRGATPSYAHGYYDRDNVFYRRWDAISRDREIFCDWMGGHILNTADFSEYLRVQEKEGAKEIAK
jgi:glutaconate CoA-transferase subunit A